MLSLSLKIKHCNRQFVKYFEVEPVSNEVNEAKGKKKSDKN